MLLFERKVLYYETWKLYPFLKKDDQNMTRTRTLFLSLVDKMII